MKKRVFLDGAILWVSGIIGISLFFLFPKTYLLEDRLLDNVLDILGITFILKGALMRMSARGHKAQFPRWDLVMTGPYSFSRNPMYLGTFVIVAGIICVALPIWLLPIFILAFYIRFNQTAQKEEEQLLDCHKENYKTYCEEVPRIFPSVEKILFAKTKDFFNFEEMIATKEKQLIFLIPLAAFLLDCLQEWRIFGSADLGISVLVFLGAYAGFFTLFVISYKIK